MIYRILTQTNRNYYRIQSFSSFVTAYYHQTKEKRLTDLRAVKATLLLYSTRVLYHSTSVCRVCRSLSHQYHQSILLYLQTWALWPEVLTYRWEDRCPRAIKRHFCHSCTLDWDLRTSWSFRMRTFYCLARLRPSRASEENHVTPTNREGHSEKEIEIHNTHI